MVNWLLGSLPCHTLASAAVIHLGNNCKYQCSNYTYIICQRTYIKAKKQSNTYLPLPVHEIASYTLLPTFVNLLINQK